MLHYETCSQWEKQLPMLFQPGGVLHDIPFTRRRLAEARRAPDLEIGELSQGTQGDTQERSQQHDGPRIQLPIRLHTHPPNRLDVTILGSTLSSWTLISAKMHLVMALSIHPVSTTVLQMIIVMMVIVVLILSMRILSLCTGFVQQKHNRNSQRILQQYRFQSCARSRLAHQPPRLRNSIPDFVEVACGWPS